MVGAGPQLIKSGAMDAAMLTDLQVGEVKAECLHLPHESMQLSIRLARSTRVVECGLERAEIIEELVRSRVGQRQIGTAGRADALGHQEEELPVRFARGPCRDGGGELAGDLSSCSKPGEEALIGRGAHVINGQSGTDARGGGLQAAEDVIRLNEHRLAGHARGDLWVPVAVAADPAAEAEKRRCGWRVRAGVTRLERFREVA